MDAELPAATQSPRPTAPTRPKEEIARLGDAIYERDIRRKVEADHHGEIVSIDVDTGIWAIGEELREAVEQLRTQRPQAIDVWSLRVGHRGYTGSAAASCGAPGDRGGW